MCTEPRDAPFPAPGRMGAPHWGEGRGAAPGVSTEWLEGQCCPLCALLARLQDRARLWFGDCGATRAPHATLALWLALDTTRGATKHRVTLGDSFAFPTVGCSPLMVSPSLSPSHFPPERETSLQPLLPGLAQ